jgi:hypothetical protein
MKPPASGSMCALACLFLLSAGILLAAAVYRPFQSRAAASWDPFSRVQQKEEAPAPPPLARRGSYRAAPPAPDAVSPSAGGPADWSPDDDDDADAGPPSPAPAPSEEGWGDGDEDAQCDLFDGEWVEDAAGYPLYDAAECPFLSDQVACRRNGRPDSGYERWRWQPRGCGGTTRLQAFVWTTVQCIILYP